MTGEKLGEPQQPQQLNIPSPPEPKPSKWDIIRNNLKEINFLIFLIVSIAGGVWWLNSEFNNVREEANNKSSEILEVVNENKTNLAVLGVKVDNIEEDINDIEDDIAEIKGEINFNQRRTDEKALYEQYGY